jgi:hypothetical protein
MRMTLTTASNGTLTGTADYSGTISNTSINIPFTLRQ